MPRGPKAERRGALPNFKVKASGSDLGRLDIQDSRCGEASRRSAGAAPGASPRAPPVVARRRKPAARRLGRKRRAKRLPLGNQQAAPLPRDWTCLDGNPPNRLEKLCADLRRFIYAPLAPVDGQGNAVAPSFSLVIGGRQAGDEGVAPWFYTMWGRQGGGGTRLLGPGPKLVPRPFRT